MTMNWRSYDLWQQQQEDCGAPTVTTIADRTRRVRKPRTLPCGHRLDRGDRVHQWVGLVDGEFTADEECPRCRDEAMYG